MTVPAGAEKNLRYTVSASDSVLTLVARSTLHAVHGKTTLLEGFVDANWSDAGTLILDPPPAIHVEFRVDQLRSGNALLDRQMWNLIDSKRFPRIAADLARLEPGSTPGRYAAAGDVTLAGRTRRYDGEISLVRIGGSVVIDGDLEFDIADFGLTPPNLVILKVNPVVKAGLHLVAKAVE